MLRKKLPEAIGVLQNGSIVVYPTDTLYAFGVNIYNENAVRKVFNVKKRPLDIPLPVAVANFTEMKRVAFVNNLCAHYRVKTFETLARYYNIDYYFFSAGDEWYWQQQHGVQSGDFH